MFGLIHISISQQSPTYSKKHSFNDISSLQSYSVNDVTGIEVISTNSGKIFIPTEAYEFEDLINTLIEQSPNINERG